MMLMDLHKPKPKDGVYHHQLQDDGGKYRGERQGREEGLRPLGCRHGLLGTEEVEWSDIVASQELNQALWNAANVTVDDEASKKMLQGA